LPGPTLHRADGHGQKIHASALDEYFCFRGHGERRLARMLLGPFAFLAAHVAHFTNDRDAAGVGQFHHLAGGLDVVRQAAIGGIEHHAVAAKANGLNHGVERPAVIELDGHRHVGAFGRGFHRRHHQFEVVMGEVGLGDGEDHRGPAVFGRIDHRLEEVEADQIEGAYRIAVLVCVMKHVLHVDQCHRFFLVS